MTSTAVCALPIHTIVNDNNFSGPVVEQPHLDRRCARVLRASAPRRVNKVFETRNLHARARSTNSPYNRVFHQLLHGCLEGDDYLPTAYPAHAGRIDRAYERHGAAAQGLIYLFEFQNFRISEFIYGEQHWHDLIEDRGVQLGLGLGNRGEPTACVHNDTRNWTHFVLVYAHVLRVRRRVGRIGVL